MLSSEDLERFYFQYQTEAVPLGMSVQTFCLRNNVPYNIFHKWYKDTRKKIVEVQVDGVPSGPPSESVPSSPSGDPPVKKDSPSPRAVHRHRKPGKGGASRAYIRGADLEQWPAYPPERSGLSGSVPSDPKAGGPMLSVTGMNRFYYLRGFTDMRCKHSRVLSVIREQLHREPSDGDIYIVMSKDRRIVRLFAYDNRSYSLFEKKFVAGYQFMRIIKDDEGNEVAYRIDWKDVVLLLESPVIKSLKIR